MACGAGGIRSLLGTDDRTGDAGLFRRAGPAILIEALVTWGVVLGAWAMAEDRVGLVAALFAGTVWVALAAPLLTASSRPGIGALLRGATPADAGAVALLVLWLADPALRFVAAVEIYVIWAVMGLAGVAAGSLARTPAWRLACGWALAGLLMLALASPLWVDGLTGLLAGADAQDVVAAALRWNPIYSVTSAVYDQTGFLWHYAPLMYRLTRVGEDVAEPVVEWYAAVWRWGVVAGALGLAAALRFARTVKPSRS